MWGALGRSGIITVEVELEALRALQGHPLVQVVVVPLVPSGTGGQVMELLVRRAQEEQEEMAGGGEGGGRTDLEEEVGPHTSYPPPQGSSLTHEEPTVRN